MIKVEFLSPKKKKKFLSYTRIKLSEVKEETFGLIYSCFYYNYAFEVHKCIFAIYLKTVILINSHVCIAEI